MAMVMEVEDDVFFADLNRQISLLITEDDDHHPYYNYPIPPHSSHLPVVSIDQAFSRTPIFQSTTLTHYKFDQISNKTCTTDHSCKGTGVFIPKSSSQWSRSRSRRTNNKQHLKPKPPIPTPTITSHTPTINDIRNKLQPPPATKSSRFFSGH